MALYISLFSVVNFQYNLCRKFQQASEFIFLRVLKPSKSGFTRLLLLKKTSSYLLLMHLFSAELKGKLIRALQIIHLFCAFPIKKNKNYENDKISDFQKATSKWQKKTQKLWDSGHPGLDEKVSTLRKFLRKFGGKKSEKCEEYSVQLRMMQTEVLHHFVCCEAVFVS